MKLKTPSFKLDKLVGYYKKYDLKKGYVKLSGFPDEKENHISFDGVPPEIIATLVDYQEADPEEAQNSSPTIAEFLEFATDQNNGDGNIKVTLHGYRIRNRDDNRVSLEGLEAVPKDGTKFTVQDILNLVEFGRHADEFEISEDYCRTWWD